MNSNKLYLIKKIFIRFGMILVSEIVFSVGLFVIIKSKLLYDWYYLLQIVVLLGFWCWMWYLARKNRHRSRSLKKYYLRNSIAYALFLAVAAIAFLLNRSSPDYPYGIIYYPAFRLSYIFGLLDRYQLDAGRLKMSMAIFYPCTFAVIVLEPVVAGIRHKIYDHKKKNSTKS